MKKTYNEFMLYEIFDRPLKWKWGRISKHSLTAEFQDSEENWYEAGASFIRYPSARPDKWHWDFWFKSIKYDADPFENTGRGNAIEILSTVISIMKSFFKKINPKIVSFSGDKSEGKAKLYMKMVKRYVGTLKDYTLNVKDVASDTVFVLTKKGQGK